MNHKILKNASKMGKVFRQRKRMVTINNPNDMSWTVLVKSFFKFYKVRIKTSIESNMERN